MLVSMLAPVRIIAICEVAAFTLELAEKLEQLRALEAMRIAVAEIDRCRVAWIQPKIYKQLDSALPPSARARLAMIGLTILEQ